MCNLICSVGIDADENVSAYEILSIITSLVKIMSLNEHKKKILVLQGPATYLKKQVDLIFTNELREIKREASDLEVPQSVHR